MDGSSLLFVGILQLANTKGNRSQGPRFCGNVGHTPVRDGNRMADMAAFLFVVVVLRGAHIAIDSPPGSVIFGYDTAAVV